MVPVGVKGAEASGERGVLIDDERHVGLVASPKRECRKKEDGGNGDRTQQWP